MNLRLSVQIPDYPFRISHQDCIFSMGSCFAAHIGERLSAHKFSLVSNPFGIVYNPASIHKALQLLLTDYQFSESDFFQQGELWHSYYHHGQFSGTNLAKAIIRVQTSAQHARQYLRRCNRLLLTLGTAQVYTLKTRGEIVANCHKMPRQAFDKRRLSVAEIVAYLQPVLAQLRASSQDFQCILTVSPVRHWRDGLVENQRSKSALLLAAAELSDTLDYVHYFPAYEWII
ncbi:MAG: GSCFA domain-containing protein, partial [Bacteroidota bacterium]